MRRKVIQLAGKTAVISLPSKWVQKYNVKKGAELELLEKGKDLLIKTDTEKFRENIILDISNFNEMTLRYAMSAIHKSGYDEITLIYNRQGQLEILQDVIQDIMVGFVVIEQKPKKIVLKSITTDLDTEFEPALRRAFLVTLSLSDASLELIKSGSFSNLSQLINLEKTNNQLTSFCLRLMNKGVYLEEKKLHFLPTIIWSLEKICDEYKYICFNLSKSNHKISNEIVMIYEKVNLFFRGYYELFYKIDIIKFNELSDKRQEIIKLINETTAKNKMDANLIRHLCSIVSKTADLSSSIFGFRHLEMKEVKKDLLEKVL